MSVEVERKFVCDPDIQSRLRDIGAVCIGHCQFHDRYYDSPDYHLTLRDVWLRHRQGSWELKCPATKSIQGMEEDQAERLCSRYREITSLPQILAKVREVLKEGCEEQERQRVTQDEQEGNEDSRQVHKGETKNTNTGIHIDQKDPMANHSNSSSIKRVSTEKEKMTGTEEANQCSLENDSDLTWLKELNLVPFAEFTTERCSFTLTEEGEEGQIRVDLDQADFGFCVGEIEVLVPDGKEVQSALKKIERTAQRLGLSGDQRVQGKMDVYLQRYCPEHYRKLLSAHVL